MLEEVAAGEKLKLEKRSRNVIAYAPCTTNLNNLAYRRPLVGAIHLNDVFAMNKMLHNADFAHHKLAHIRVAQWNDFGCEKLAASTIDFVDY